MKKFLLSAVLAVTLMACSADDSATTWDNNAVADNEVNFKNASTTLPLCFAGGIGPTLSVDLTNGINNPQFDFKADLKGVYPRESRRVKYLLSVEMQMLADCEDILVPQGEIVKITNPNYYTLNNDSVKPTIRLQESQLLTGCYRWRLVIDGYAVDGGLQTCSTASYWKDAPLY